MRRQFRKLPMHPKTMRPKKKKLLDFSKLPERYKQYEYILADYRFFSLRSRASFLNWFINIEKFILFKEKNGHGDVPQNHREIGKWVNKMRSNYKDGKLTPFQINLLNEEGFQWAKDSKGRLKWDRQYQSLIAFKKEFGHCRVKTKYKTLGRWVSRQRYLYKKYVGIGSEEICEGVTGAELYDRFKLLDKVGFDWGPTDATNDTIKGWSHLLPVNQPTSPAPILGR